MRKVFIFALFGLTVHVSASDIVSFSPFTMFATSRSFQGTPIWDAPIAAAAVGITFFDRISLQGPGVSYRERFSNGFSFEWSVGYFDDEKPEGPIVRIGSDNNSYRRKRRPTFETTLKLKYKKKGKGEIFCDFKQDIKRHWGSYGRIGGGFSLLPFTTLGAALALSSQESSKYAYGPTAKSGLAHYDLYHSTFLPFLPWHGNLILSGTFSKLLQKENSHAEYTRGKSDHYTFSAMATWRI